VFGNVNHAKQNVIKKIRDLDSLDGENESDEE